MKKTTLLKTAALSLAIAPALSTAADRVGDFSLLDQDGYYHSMSWLDDHKAVALLVQANGSDATAAAVPAFDALRAEYDAKGIEFFMINPMGKKNRAEVKAELAEYGVEIPVLMDDSRLISEALGVAQTGEVIVFNPSKFTVDYQGSVAGAEAALAEIAAGQAVTAAMVAANGEAISFSSNDSISYSKDIAPVLAENCASCHREGGIAPFAMDSHAMVQGWSPMIREVLMTKRMPPGQIDGHIGEFLNGMVLDDQQVRNVIAWAEAGAPKDGDEDPLTQLTWPESEWAFGEPDYIITVPTQQVPATGVLDYRDVAVKIDIPTDRYLRGSQYIAGDPTVLHHTINRLDFPGESRGGFLGSNDPDKASITPYIPGADPVWNPDNTGGLVKAGSVLNLNLHYTTTGRESVDDGKIGLWFYPEDVIPEERMSGACACIFPPSWTSIPPNDPNFEQTASITIKKDANIMSFTPHMHFRGKYMRFFADFPDGTSEELINIAQYDYAWQRAYTLAEPRFVPGGTKIRAVGAFDNSAQNPANPDPEREVPWGQQSWDEMFFGAVNWKYTEQGGED
ncbi:MAG: redoxin domain-containing protein [Pseudohongiellaceae bacterium]